MEVLYQLSYSPAAGMTYPLDHPVDETVGTTITLLTVATRLIGEGR